MLQFDLNQPWLPQAIAAASRRALVRKQVLGIAMAALFVAVAAGPLMLPHTWQFGFGLVNGVAMFLFACAWFAQGADLDSLSPANQRLCLEVEAACDVPVVAQYLDHVQAAHRPLTRLEAESLCACHRQAQAREKQAQAKAAYDRIQGGTHA